MCGRVEIDPTDDIIVTIARKLRSKGLAFKTGEVFPTEPLPAVVGVGSKLELTVCPWNYRGGHGRRPLINVRSETVLERPLLAADFQKRRLVIPCSAFYEWRDGQRYFFAPPEGLLFLAGFASPLNELTILTKAGTPPVAAVHSRSPVILKREEIKAFIKDTEIAVALCRKDLPAEALLMGQGRLISRVE